MKAANWNLIWLKNFFYFIFFHQKHFLCCYQYNFENVIDLNSNQMFKHGNHYNQNNNVQFYLMDFYFTQKSSLILTIPSYFYQIIYQKYFDLYFYLALFCKTFRILLKYFFYFFLSYRHSSQLKLYFDYIF
jgi:hypothetical protein